MSLKFFRVFYGLIINCISAVCKCIEGRLKKDGVLMVRKRRFSSQKTSFSSEETAFFVHEALFRFSKDVISV